MKIGIVGAGAEKFTAKTMREAQSLIRKILSSPGVSTVVSGNSPVGGIDIWAEHIGRDLGLETLIFSPKVHSWNPSGAYGFKQRNLDIAASSDELHVIVVASYPTHYTGRRFDRCYHCPVELGPNHVKSGGCWTGWRAHEMGKKVTWDIIGEER